MLFSLIGLAIFGTWFGSLYILIYAFETRQIMSYENTKRSNVIKKLCTFIIPIATVIMIISFILLLIYVIYGVIHIKSIIIF